MTSFYNDFGGKSQPTPPANPTNNSYGLLGRINEFAKTVQDPEGTVKQLLNSGKMSQDQFKQYAQIANLFMGGNGGHK